MELDYEALTHVHRALSIFEGIGDSFGSRMYSEVATDIVETLVRNQRGREECSRMMGEIGRTLDKCQEMMQS